MKVGEICNREVVICRKESSLLEAAKLMREFHVGSLVVVEERGKEKTPVGIITDRDILVEVLAEGVEAHKVAVDDIMATDLVRVKPEDDMYDAIQEMRRKGIRRIPVVDSKQNLVGILSMDDVLEVLGEELKNLSSIYSREKEEEKQKRP